MFKYNILAAVLALAPGLLAQNCQLPTIRLPFGNCSFSPAKETYVHSTGILLGVGSSDSVCGMTSTVVNSTLLQSSDVCSVGGLTQGSGSSAVNMTAAQCRSRRGGLISRGDVTAASQDALSSLSALNPGWVAITNNDTDKPFQYAVETDLRMQDQSITMVQGLISQGQQHAMSHIGLAESSTLLQSLKDADLIGAKSWGLDAGSQSFVAPRNGSLVLGGYDAACFNEGWFTYPISTSSLVRKRNCPLQVEITDLAFTVRTKNNKSITDEPVTPGNKFTACIEPYDNQFRFPRGILNRIIEKLGGEDALINRSQHPDLYSVEPGLAYDASSNISFSMSFTIGDGLSIEIPSHELVRPLRGLDKNGAPVVNSSITEVQVYAEEGPGEGPVLGKVFLSQVLYLFVNYENSTFSLARQDLDQRFLDVKSSGTCPPTPALTKTDKGLIAVGVILGILIIAIVAYVIYRYLKRPLVRRGSDTEQMRDAGDDSSRPVTPRAPNIGE